MANGLPDLLPYEDTRLANVQRLVRLKTHLAGYFFDAFLNVNYTSELTITNHPVQNGANVSDHAYQEPVTIKMEILMSDSAVNYDDDTGADSNSNSTFEGLGYTRSVGAYRLLRQLQKDRRVFTIGTRLEEFQNMMIESINVDDDVETLYGLKATVTLKQVFIANEKVVKASLRSQTTETTSTTVSTPVTTGVTNDVYIWKYEEEPPQSPTSVTFYLSNSKMQIFYYPKDKNPSSEENQKVRNSILQFLEKYKLSSTAKKFLGADVKIKRYGINL